MDVQQQIGSSGHAPYFEMMSDKCKSPTAALTCPDKPKDNSVLPEILKQDEYSDTAASPVPETSAVPETETENREVEEETEREEPEPENETSEVSVNKASASSAYSIVDILNASSSSSTKAKEENNMDKSETKSVPSVEQQLKSNLPEKHPLKTTAVVIETPRPADFDMYHGIGKMDKAQDDDIPASRENSLLRKNLTEQDHKQNTSEEKSKEHFASAEHYKAWYDQIVKKTGDEPEAKRQKTDQQLSPSVANSYLQGQAAASLWYQNMAAVAGVVQPYGPYSGVFPDQAAGNLAVNPGYLLPGQSKNTPSTTKPEKKKANTMMQTNHRDLFQCPKCPRTFVTRKKFILHENTHPSPRPFNCGLALKHKSEDYTNTCILCSEKFVNAEQMCKHIMQVHRKQSAALTAPSTVSSSSSSSSPHTTPREDGIMASYRCSFCAQFLPSRAELIEHEKIHLVRAKPSDPTVKCPKCPEVFMNAISCKDHERKHHPPMSQPRTIMQPEFPEPELRATMLQDCLLSPDQGDHPNNNNSLESNGNLDHTCLICQKQFISAKMLKSHVKFTHLEERPYSCSICSKSFKQKATLKQHEKLHQDEKPYVCNICSRGFVYPSRLKTHAQTCKGEPVMSP